MKGGSSLVVTPSSIPSSTTQGPDADLSSNEGSEEVLEDSEDELVMRTMVSDFEEDGDGSEHKTKAMVMCLLSLTDFLFLFFL